jgi:hypothetical protein
MTTLSGFCSAQHMPSTCDFLCSSLDIRRKRPFCPFFDSLVYLGRICALKTLVFASRPLLEIRIFAIEVYWNQPLSMLLIALFSVDTLRPLPAIIVYCWIKL